MSELPLNIGSVSLAFSGRDVLRDVSLTIRNPGCTVLLGPNGAGKSLLLRLIHGLTEPDSGTIRWGDQTAAQARIAQALMFQNPVLLRRTVAANLRFALKARKLPLGDIEPLLARVGLLDKATQPARRLSGGEAQRLALARALAIRPKVLLLDEPTANLDPSATHAIEAILQDLRTDGIKVICVTHDIAQARRIGDEVVFLHQGQVRLHQPINRFFDAPDDPIARDFLAGRIDFDHVTETRC